MSKLYLLFCAIVLVCYSCDHDTGPLVPVDRSTYIFSDDREGPFYHGVASGDPTQEAVIIWTKATPDHHMAVNVGWKVSDRSDMSNVLYDGQVLTDSSTNYTVKVDVTDLDPGKTYYYQFDAKGQKSPIGRTKTMPRNGAEELSIGAVSCSNFEWGYFNAYERLAERDVDVVVHLGDYIYEYGPGSYGDTTIGRINRPDHEILTLSDYRTRYAQYRWDTDLQRVHQQHPFIAIWDDHEVTNNVYTEGAQNHQEDEGDFQHRKAIAKQVYYEWMPIRENEDQHHYRSFKFGDLASLIMLDERLAGRTKPSDSYEEISDANKMLGSDQLEWFKKELSDGTTTWKIVGNQVIFADLDLSSVYGSKVNLDAWDGYPSEKKEIIQYLTDESIENTVLLTGDTHSSWAFEIENSDDQSVAIEIGTPSITSANSDEHMSTDTVMMAEKVIQMANPHLKYVDLRNHGYTIIDITKNGGLAKWYYINDLRTDSSSEDLAKEVKFENNQIVD